MQAALLVLFAVVGGSLAQTLTNQSCVSQPCILGTSFVDIALVIDSSNSIDAAYYDAIKSFVITWASDYSIGSSPNQVQFGFVTYGLWGSSLGTFSTASPDMNTLSDVVKGFYRQGTNDRNMLDALTKVSNNLISADANSGWRQTAKHLMVVFSGDSFTGPDWKAIATTLRGQFDRVVAVGLTQKAVLNQYSDLVELVGGDASNVFLIGGASGLKYIIPWLEYQACALSSSGGNGTTTVTVSPPPTTPGGGTSTGPITTTTTTTTPMVYRTCQDYYLNGQNISGVYPITINGTTIEVYCDMDKDGGWTIIQSRIDGKVNFNVSYDAYRYTLGKATDPFGDFWLGNEYIHALTQMFKLQLRIKLYDCDSGVTTAKYKDFRVDGSDNKYALHTDAITDDSDGGDAFNTRRFGHNDQGRPFATAATYDPLGGETGGPNADVCKALLYGGWWFGSCVDNLNGKWYDVQKPLCLDNYPDGIRWIRGGNYSLPKTIMEVMPNTGGWF